MKKHFISFADSKLLNTLNRIKSQAINSNFFDSVETFNENFLSHDIKEYCINNHRGFGYWIWKPILIKEYLKKINFGDLLVYCDAGCTINSEGKQRFDEYVSMLSKNDDDIITFNMYSNLEKFWSKMDIFLFFNSENLMETGQIGATSIILKKTEKTIKLIDEWEHICVNHRNLIDDSKSKSNESDVFIDNRHDQSIFSMVAKKYKTIELQDETYMIVNGNHQNFNKQYPIHATRLRF
jgi:hypothetical protein